MPPAQQDKPSRKRTKQQGRKVPDYEKDINALIDTFCDQVRGGRPCNLATFKSVWSCLYFSFIHQAVPSALLPIDHLQLLYSSALNRLDTLWPDTGPEAAAAPHQTQADPSEQQQQGQQEQGNGDEGQGAGVVEAEDEDLSEFDGWWSLLDDEYIHVEQAAVEQAPTEHLTPAQLSPVHAPVGPEPAGGQVHTQYAAAWPTGHDHQDGQAAAMQGALDGGQLLSLFDSEPLCPPNQVDEALLDAVLEQTDEPVPDYMALLDHGYGGLCGGQEGGAVEANAAPFGGGIDNIAVHCANASDAAAVRLDTEGEGQGTGASATATAAPDSEAAGPASAAGDNTRHMALAADTCVPSEASQAELAASAANGAVVAGSPAAARTCSGDAGAGAFSVLSGQQGVCGPWLAQQGDPDFDHWLAAAADGYHELGSNQQGPTAPSSTTAYPSHAWHLPSAEGLPPLDVRVGAIYTLYCLYQTQSQRPRCRIYLPLVLLELLISMVPELLAAGALEAAKLLQKGYHLSTPTCSALHGQVLWQGNAFLVGCIRREASYIYRQPRSASQRTPASIHSLSVTSSLLDDPAARDALYHLRSDIRSLVDYKRLGEAVSRYHTARESIFAPAPHPSSQRGASALLPGHAPAGLPPMLFPAGYAQDLKQCIEDQAKQVQQSLLPDSRPSVQQRGGKRSADAAVGVGAEGGGSKAAQRKRARRRARRMGLVGADIIRNGADQQTPNLPAELQSDLADELQGLSGAQLAVVQAQLARQQHAGQVQSLWLSAYEQLAQQEQQQQGQDQQVHLPQGPGDAAAPGTATEQGQGGQSPAGNGHVHRRALQPLHEGGASLAGAAATGVAHIYLAAGTQEQGAEGAQAEEAARQLQSSGAEGLDDAGHMHVNDAAAGSALDAELDQEFGGGWSEDESGRGGGTGKGVEEDSSAVASAANGHAAPQPGSAKLDLVPVWCNSMPGLVMLTGSTFAVTCFCSECQVMSAEGSQESSFSPVEFMQHCGLKSSKWRQSLVVDEELVPAVAACSDAAHVRGLLQGRTPVRRGGKKLGSWLNEQLPQGALKSRKRLRETTGDLVDPAFRDYTGALGSAEALAGAAAATLPTAELQVDDEYADLLAQYDKYSKVMASVEHLTNGAAAGSNP